MWSSQQIVFDMFEHVFGYDVSRILETACSKSRESNWTNTDIVQTLFNPCFQITIALIGADKCGHVDMKNGFTTQTASFRDGNQRSWKLTRLDFLLQSTRTPYFSISAFQQNITPDSIPFGYFEIISSRTESPAAAKMAWQLAPPSKMFCPVLLTMAS